MFQEGAALEEYEFNGNTTISGDMSGEATDLGSTTPATGQARLYPADDEKLQEYVDTGIKSRLIDSEEMLTNGRYAEQQQEEMKRIPTANTLLKMKKMDHKILIQQEIDARKQQVREMDRGEGPHPLETVIRKEVPVRRPMTVNEEIFLGLGIGENEKDPKVAAIETRKKQNAYLQGLDKDMEIKVALEKAKKDDDMFQYRDRKPITRKTYDGVDIDLDSLSMAYGRNEKELAEKKRAEANQWMMKASADFDAIKAKKREAKKAELAAPVGEAFMIGKESQKNPSLQERRQAQAQYAKALEDDMALMKKDPSSTGLDINFTFGGKSRDDRATTADIRDKRQKQLSYKNELDVQIDEQAQMRAYQRALDHAVPQALPPYAENHLKYK